MMNFICKTLKSIVFSRRTFLLLCVLLNSLLFFAMPDKSGQEWYAEYKANINSSKSTGSGTVYMKTDRYSNTDANDYQIIVQIEGLEVKENLTPSNVKTLNLKTVLTIGNNHVKTALRYNNITLVADCDAFPGSYFKHWVDASGNVINANAEYRICDVYPNENGWQQSKDENADDAQDFPYPDKAPVPFQ